MSMEMRVFFAGPIPTAQALERTMAEIGLSFRITDHVSLGDHSGFLPMTYGSGEDLDETGVEVYSDPAAPDIEDLGITGVDPAFVEQLSFRWGGDMMACVAAEALAAAIAKITGGIVYEDTEGVLKTTTEAIALAHTNLAYALKKR
jgi:hypothetical protein